MSTQTWWRCTRSRSIAVLAVWSVLGPLASAQNGAPRLDVEFQNEPMGEVLELLARGYGLQYALDEGVNPELPITASLIGVTVEQALRILLEPNGLTAIDEDGRYVISEHTLPTEHLDDRATVTPVAAAGARPTPPPPVRPRAYASGPSATAVAGEDGGDEEEDTILEVIWPRYIGAGMASAIFGGGMIDAGAALGGGSGSYGGGYGSSGTYAGGYGSGSSYGTSYGTPQILTGDAAMSQISSGDYQDLRMGRSSISGNVGAFSKVLPGM